MIQIAGVHAVVLDIEGTTSSLSFVKDTLFPFARRRLPVYVRDHEKELGEILGDIRMSVGNQTLGTDEITQVLLHWMDEDRKVTALKSLQGLIWKAGYESGELQGHIYDDALHALQAWHRAGIKIYIYSSGSVAAQQLLFRHTRHGDLTTYLSGYFDTTTGPKLEAASYTAIARRAELAPGALLFLSDHPGEVQAACAAGMQAVRVDRDASSDATGTTAVIHSFDELSLATS